MASESLRVWRTDAVRFQGFVRALQVHTAEAIALGAHNATYTELLRENLTSNGALERQNA